MSTWVIGPGQIIYLNYSAVSCFFGEQSGGGGGSSGGGGGGADTLSSTCSSDATCVISYSPLESSHNNLTLTCKETGCGRLGDKEKEKKDTSHNSEACLFTKEKDGSAATYVSWGKLPSRKLEKFLADVNAKGAITIPLEEVRELFPACRSW